MSIDRLNVDIDPPRGETKRARALAPLRIPAYRRLAVALVLSSFASGMWVVTLVWEVIRIGGEASQLSMVITAHAVGVVVPALLGGVLADRVQQKTILLAVATVELWILGVVTVLSATDQTRQWHLAAAALVKGVAFAFYYPAYSAWLPALVPACDLMAANGIEGTVRPTINQALGPGAAGALVAAGSPGVAFAVAAVASLGGVLALTRVPTTPVQRDPATFHGGSVVRSVIADMKDGFDYMVRTRWLAATLGFAIVMVLVMIGPFEVLMPFLVKERLGGGPEDHAVVMAAYGIGGAMGSAVMATMHMPRRYLTFMILSWGFGCLPFALMGTATQIWVVVASAFIFGFAFTGPMVLWGTLLQRRVPPALLGRVSALDYFVSVSLMPVSMALAGPVAGLIGLGETFLLAGVLPAIAAVAVIVVAGLRRDELAHPLRR
jgi:MFS family permease